MPQVVKTEVRQFRPLHVCSHAVLQLPQRIGGPKTTTELPSRNAKLPRWSRLRFWQYHRENSVSVCHFRPVPVDLMRNRDGSFESSVSSFHEAVASGLVLSFRAFHSAHHERVGVDRNIDIFLSRTRHLDTNNHRMRRFPSPPRDRAPARKILG